MEQEDIERIAFLYLCGKRDKNILLDKEEMTLADFDRLTYLISHFGMEHYHIKIWNDYFGKFQAEMDRLEALHETGGHEMSLERTKSEVRLHEMWVRDFCKNAPKETRKWLLELDQKICDSLPL